MACSPDRGARLLESVYEVILAYELRKRALVVERQVPMPVHSKQVLTQLRMSGLKLGY